MSFHQPLDRRTSSVASGRAKNRKGTNVVPSPGETCIAVPFFAKTPCAYVALGWASSRRPGAVGHDDLAAVEMAGEDQIEAARLDEVERSREVAQQEPKIGIRGREAARPVGEPRAGVDAGELDPLAVDLDLGRRVEEQRPALELPESAPASRTGRARARSRGCRARRRDRCGSRSSSSSSFACPAGRESRSPVMQIRSGRRSATQSTARSTARTPRDGTPRWKSERCAIRSPSSSRGSDGSEISWLRRRTQPASNQPHVRPPAATAPNAAASFGRIRPRASRGPA